MISAKMKRKMYIMIIVMAMVLSSCYTIMSLVQPTTALTNEIIDVSLIVRTEPDPVYGLDNEYHHGIVGVMIPNDWTVNVVYYSGPDADPPEGYFSFLHPDSADGDPGGNVDYWADTLEARWPSGPDREWRVYQSDEKMKALKDTTFNDLYIQFVSGEMTGTYDIGYFVTNAALDFDEDHYYDISLDNPITINDPSAIEDKGQNPATFALNQNYPNPFNPSTTIRYSVEKSGLVQLLVYDVSGKQVSTIVNGFKQAGSHQARFIAPDLASGIYYYRLIASDQVLSRKMILVK